MFGYCKDLSLGNLFTRNNKRIHPMNIQMIYNLRFNTCYKICIGQTQVEVSHRMNQHWSVLIEEGKSAAADHIIMNRNYQFTLNKSEILARDHNKKRREIKETLLTLKHSNEYNSTSHDLVIFY